MPSSTARFAGLSWVVAVAIGCESQASAGTPTPSAADLATVIDSLETSNQSTERLLDSARAQLDSSLQAMVAIASITDRIAGGNVKVVARNKPEIEGSDRESLASLQRNSLARLNSIRTRLESMDATLDRVRDTSKTLRAEVQRLTQLVRSISNASAAQTERIKELAVTLEATRVERDRAVATSNGFRHKADTLKETLDRTVEQTRVRDDSVFALVGDATTLEKLGVAQRTGGVLGIGRVLRLNGEFPRDAFDVLSKERAMTIPMPRKDRTYRLLSAQSPGCYAWTTTADSTPALEVQDRGCFWETSRYLVIEERR